MAAANPYSSLEHQVRVASLTKRGKAPAAPSDRAILSQVGMMMTTADLWSPIPVLAMLEGVRLCQITEAVVRAADLMPQLAVYPCPESVRQLHDFLDNRIHEAVREMRGLPAKLLEVIRSPYPYTLMAAFPVEMNVGPCDIDLAAETEWRGANLFLKSTPPTNPGAPGPFNDAAKHICKRMAAITVVRLVHGDFPDIPAFSKIWSKYMAQPCVDDQEGVASEWISRAISLEVQLGIFYQKAIGAQ